MNCIVCGGKGILRLKYHGGEPDEFALCLCASGLAWRTEANAGRNVAPLWWAWAARERVDYDSVGFIEEFFTDDELRGMFPFYRAGTDNLGAPIATDPIEERLIAAARTRRTKL